MRIRVPLVWTLGAAMLGACGVASESNPSGESVDAKSSALDVSSFMTAFRAPAGDLPATRDAVIDGVHAAVLPNGRLVTPAGTEIGVLAPKPNGIVSSPDGSVVATTNNGAGPFSVTLIRNLGTTPTATRVDIDATFMGIQFSPDGQRFYAAGGENGNIWVGDLASNKVIGSINLNGAAHPLDRPLAVNSAPAARFKGAFPGNMALSGDGRYLYVLDQGGFRVHVVDTSKLLLGADADGKVTEPDNFAAVVGGAASGRYPFGIALSPNGTKLFVTHVGVFQYSHLRPATPTGDSNVDYPLCYPGAGYPEETESARTLLIKPVDPRNLPTTLRDPQGIRCGFVKAPQTYLLPGLGSPNVPESSSVYVYDIRTPSAPVQIEAVKTGLLVGEVEHGIAAYAGSHPNSVVVGTNAVYVANGNNDSISELDPESFEVRSETSLSVLPGWDRRLKGVQPVALRLSVDGRRVFVAEAGLNAVAVLSVERRGLELEGMIPVGWWPSALDVSPDGRTLFVANANGRGAGPDNDAPPDNLGSPKFSTLGSVSAVRVPNRRELVGMTARVLANNGMVPSYSRRWSDPANPIPAEVGTPSRKIRHVVFINKENSTHDLMLGDVTETRRGNKVNGEPRYSLGVDASPNHHELALSFAFSDNFFLEPSVSSDGHRWLNNNYTSEFEETHWPASYGGRRRDAGDDPAVILGYPGRIGFTDANSSPEPNDLNQHGGIYMHLSRHGKSFVNFGNGYEFAILDEDNATEPTGVREHVNVPMEKVLRDRSDHLYPEYNTHIPDAPLAEDPARFSRFGRFKQIFESHYVDGDRCKLPSYVDLYYPNDHGGGARDIHPDGPDWSFRRFVQDNDAALGLTVDLISHSPCWKDTVIFVVEDDTQNGLDHVDGHRSLFLAVSPWVKREHVSHLHTSLSSVFKTVDLILGIPPLNQYDAAATDLSELFTGKPDFTPYSYVPVAFEGQGNALYSALTRDIDFDAADADEVPLRTAITLSEGLPRVLD